MKKNSQANTKLKKQMMSAGVYIALAVAVTAVTVSTISSVFERREFVDNAGLKENSEIGIPITFPETDVNDFTLDSPVSDVTPGVDATVTESKKTDETESESKKENETENSPESSESSDQTQLNEKEETKQDDAETEKKSAFSEEPEEDAFEMSYNGFIRPVIGYISKEFSVELPVYSATMYDYRTHDGIDIVCESGTPVKAVSGGVIKEIYDDYLLGTTVVIEHKDGICSVYSNLSPELPKETVVGKNVATGDIFAGVGNSAMGELAEASHLHFEMTENGVKINPETFLP